MTGFMLCMTVFFLLLSCLAVRESNYPIAAASFLESIALGLIVFCFML
jgi:hypothetical protein